jgi:outer membrane protein assembly factor BamD (BamD/ComL family)
MKHGRFVLAGLLLGASAACALGEEPLERAETIELDPARREWVGQEPPVPGTPAGDLQLARALHSQGKHGQAKAAVRKWIKTYGPTDELYPEAVLLECNILIAQEDYYKAHTRLQEFLNEFSGTQYQERALRAEFVIAESFLKGKRRKFLGLPMLKADDTGLAILDDIVANYPESGLAELATLTKANYYYENGDFAFAEQEYEYLVERFPRSRYGRRARFQAASAAQASFAGIDFDDAPLIEAEERFTRYLALYPNIAEQEGVGLLLADIAQTRAAKELSIGDYYRRTKHLRAARFYYQSTIDHWPESTAAIAARQRIEALGEIPETEEPGPGPSVPATGPTEGERPE